MIVTKVIVMYISSFTVAVIRYHDQSKLKKKELFGLMVPEGEDAIWLAEKCGSKQHTC